MDETKKEFGKWLMDVSKYMFTAIVITSVFSDLKNHYILFAVALFAMATLLLGLLLFYIGSNNNK